MSEMGDDLLVPGSKTIKKPESHKFYGNRDVTPGSDLWTNGLIYAFEFVRAHRKWVNSKLTSKKSGSEIDTFKTQMQANGEREVSYSKLDRNNLLDSPSISESRDNQTDSFDDMKESRTHSAEQYHDLERCDDSHWVAIGWDRISELVQAVQTDATSWAAHQLELMNDEDSFTVADLAAPYWEHPAGPVWWCHVDAGRPSVQNWFSNAPWLHPAISLALRDESRLISERMKHLLYEIPVRVAGGLLFELLGQSAGNPDVEEDDVPIVLRSWQAQNYLITALHIKGHVSRVNVLGITEVQELLSAGGYNAPQTVHEVIGQLACHLTRWDDRLFRKSIFGAADEVELKFMQRSKYEDMNLLSIILNQEIRRLSRQVIRVKWSLHAREEIVFELLQHLRGNTTRMLLEGIRKSTREMMEEQEAVRGRLFTIQDVMQGTVRAWLQDRSLRVTHNLVVFGGCGLVLSIITGLFGINVDGIPGAESTPYAFGLFAGILVFIGVVLIGVGLLCLGFKQPISDERFELRKLELQELVKLFQHEAETHAQVRKNAHRNNLPPTSGDTFSNDVDYILVQ